MASTSDGQLSVVAVGQAERSREKIFIAPIFLSKNLVRSDRSFAKEYDRQLAGNFAFYRRFYDVVKATSPRATKVEDFDRPDYASLALRSGHYLIHSLLKRTGKLLELQAKVFSIGERRELLAQRFILPTQSKERRGIVHILSDGIYRAIAGKQSIFGSKIVFVSDVASRGKQLTKELYIMDFDGHNKRRLTRHRGIVISPSIDPFGRRVLYSLIRYSKGKKKNVNLRLFDIPSKQDRLLSSSPGLNSGAVFAPDGDSIYLTMSDQGNAEIYQMNLATGKRRRITRRRGEDVDPSVDASGKLMAFLSARQGRPMIYIADTDGQEKNVRRISYTGQFNATPRFAPSGRELAFSSWQKNRFDIYRIDSDGQALARLTRNFGSNESPSYSRDGEFIVFASLRVLTRKRALQDLYIMDREGEIIGPVSKNFGRCSSPRWSK